MSALDLLVDGFPHGTKAGYELGCKGAICPAPIQCRDARRRYVSDFAFRRMVDAGATVAEILAEDQAAVVRDREEERVRRRAEAAADRAPRPKVTREPKPRKTWTHGTRYGYQRGGCRENCPATPTCREVHYARESERRERARANRPAPPVVEHGTLAGYDAGCFRVDCPSTPTCADVNLAHHGHIVLPKPRPERTARAPREPKAPGERRSRWDHVEKQPHGTNARHAGGCKTDEGCPNAAAGGITCLEAHKQYMREYRAARRSQPIPAENHGTRYGYALGCRAGAVCPSKPSCADVEADADMKRRRARGVQPAPSTVPSQPVREHVRALMNAGMAVATVAERAEVSLSGVKTLMYGRSGRRKGYLPRSIKADTAAKILGLSA